MIVTVFMPNQVTFIDFIEFTVIKCNIYCINIYIITIIDFLSLFIIDKRLFLQCLKKLLLDKHHRSINQSIFIILWAITIRKQELG